MAARLVFFLLAAGIFSGEVAAIAPSAATVVTDAAALVALKGSFANTAALTKWNIENDPNATPCPPGAGPWPGVVCFQGQVIGLRLADLALGGTVDVVALTQIKGLRTMSLSNNSFVGNIPRFELLPGLKSLYVSNNGFTGELPDDFFQKLSHIKKLWLDGNMLIGLIPSTLGKAAALIELRLERNNFTGQLPNEPPPALADFNVSSNNLDGAVPQAFKKFGAQSFADNKYLCYETAPGKQCARPETATDASSRVGVVFLTVVAVAGLVVLAAMLCQRPNRADDFDTLGGPPGAGGGGSVSGSSHRDPSSHKAGSQRPAKSGDQSAHGADAAGDPSRSGDLVVVNERKGIFGMQDLMKAAAEVLGNGSLGSAYQAVMASGVSVAVKRVRGMEALETKESFDAEMRRLAGLRHPNVHAPLAYHYRKDEKLLITEYIPKGSLLYVLHGDRGIDHAALADWPKRLRIARGVARGLAHLDGQQPPANGLPPHGDLKSGNILLAPDFEPLLTDYGFAPMVEPARAAQTLFAYRAPECLAGAAAPTRRSDVYCLGVVLLELLTGKFPSQYHHSTQGGTDLVMWATTAIAEEFEAEILDNAMLVAAKAAIPDMKRLLLLAMSFVEQEPERRPSIEEATQQVEQLTEEALARSSGPPSHVALVRDGSARRPGSGDVSGFEI